MNAVQAVNRLFLLACAPFLGVLIWLLSSQFSLQLPKLSDSGAPAAVSIGENADTIAGKLETAAGSAGQIQSLIQKFYDMYEKSSSEAAAALKIATSQVDRPNRIFDARVSAVFGNPVRSASSGNIDLKLYSFNAKNYKGYALKAALKTDKAMNMVLGQDKLGGAETTLSEVNRYGAIAGVNAGGFADDNTGRYPTDNTILNGKFVYGFFPTHDDYAFVGISTGRKLIGGKFSRQSDLDRLNPAFGASFQPVLMQGGQSLPIPSKWLTPYRAPRTVVGNFKNDQLLFIVTDGYDENGGSGATLAELQDTMSGLGIRDAYNLDGGGSSTLVFDGKIINNPSDGKMRQLPTHFLFFK